MRVKSYNNNTALHIAAEFGNVDAAKWLVEHAGIEVGQKNSKGETALDMARRERAKDVVEYLDMENIARTALQKGDHETLEQLLEKGFDVNTKYKDKNYKDYRPLHFAAEEGQDIVTCILLTRNADVNAKNSQGLTPLHLAAWAGHIKVITALISSRADASFEDAEGRRAIHLASMGGHVPALQELAVHGGIEVVTNDSNRKTPLHLAAEFGNLEAVRFLVAQRVDINKTDARGRTALEIAKDDAQKPVVKFLHESDPFNAPERVSQKGGTKDRGRTALQIATEELHKDVVAYLHNADPLNAPERVEQLRNAVASGDAVAVKNVIDKGINLKNPKLGDHGESIVHTAVSKGNREIVELLLCNGAPKDAVDRDGNTVTHYAAANNNVEILETLNRLNCVNMNATNLEGNTLLHVAAKKDNIEAIKWLFAKGAKKGVKNNDGHTAKQIAAFMENYIAADIIKKQQ